MKKLSLLSLLICLTFNVKAQTIVPLRNAPFFTDYNYYYKDIDNDLEKFTGIWVYNDGNHDLKINIIKVENETMIINPTDIRRFFRDYLYVEIQYKYNNVLLYDTFNTLLPNFHIIQGNSLNNEGRELLLHYDEPPINDRCSRHKITMLKISYVQSNPSTNILVIGGNNNTLSWERIPEIISFPIKNCDDGLPEDTSDFLIPENLTLHRE